MAGDYRASPVTVYHPMPVRASLLKLVRWVAGAVVVISTILNFWDTVTSFGKLPPDDVVDIENRFAPIRFALRDQGYVAGDLGFATPRALEGKDRTSQYQQHWVKLRYAAIPLNLLDGAQDAPWVIVDFTGGEPIQEAPKGLIKFYDHGDGLVLYKKVSP